MLGKFGSYRTALYLSIAVALTNCVGWGLIAFHQRGVTERVLPMLVILLLIPIGLWLTSNLARYGGAVFMVVWAGSMIWPVLSSGMVFQATRVPLTLFYLFSAALSLLTAAILVLSKKFATEFADEQKHGPKYKNYLWFGLLIAIFASMIIATFNDIINLASKGQP